MKPEVRTVYFIGKWLNQELLNIGDFKINQRVVILVPKREKMARYAVIHYPTAKQVALNCRSWKIALKKVWNFLHVVFLTFDILTNLFILSAKNKSPIMPTVLKNIHYLFLFKLSSSSSTYIIMISFRYGYLHYLHNYVGRYLISYSYLEGTFGSLKHRPLKVKTGLLVHPNFKPETSS